MSSAWAWSGAARGDAGSADDALVLVGQHGVYCQSARQPGKPAMDIQIISECLTDAKELVASVMTEMQAIRG